MFASFLFMTAFQPKELYSNKNEYLFDLNVSGLSMPNNWTIDIDNISVPCIQISSDRNDKQLIIVPHSQRANLHGYLQAQIYHYFDKYLISDRMKADSIMEQLEHHPPSQIEYFKNINKRTQRAEKISDYVSYLPFSDYYNPFKYDPKDYKYAYTYKYWRIFQVYHNYFQYSQTGKSFLCESMTDEGDAFCRTFENLKYIINHFDDIVSKYDDPFGILHKNYIEFNSAYNSLMRRGNIDMNKIMGIQKKVSNIVLNFIANKNTDFAQVMNVYGIILRVNLVSSITPLNGGPRVDCFYLNNFQVKEAIDKLNSHKSLFQIIGEFFSSICLLLIVLFLKLSGMNYFALLIASTLCLNKVAENNSTSNNLFWLIKEKLAWILSISSSDSYIDDTMIINVKKREENYAEGRELLKNMLIKAVDGYNEHFILRIDKSEQYGFDVNSLLLFPK